MPAMGGRVWKEEGMRNGQSIEEKKRLGAFGEAISGEIGGGDQRTCSAQSTAASNSFRPAGERLGKVSLSRKNITRRAGASDS